MTYRVLVIDDLRSFRDERVEAEVTYARTSAEALEILNDGTSYDEIWFDHDLGMIDDDRVDSTMPVVDFLSEMSFNDTPYPVDTVLVHTSNPVGRDNIIRSLSRWGYNIKSVPADDYFVGS